MGKRSLFVVVTVVAALLSTARVGAEECVSLTEPIRCLLEGKIFAQAVDTERFLVAVDLRDENGESDGNVDHLFLFAQNRPPEDLPDSIVEGVLWIDTGEGIADIRIDGREAAPIHFKDRPTSHYWGIGAKGRIEWLENIQPAAECDHYEGSCWVANGWRIGFPL